MSGELKGLHKRRAEKEAELSPQIARRLFYIDPADPAKNLRWKESPNGRAPAHSVAGYIRAGLYRLIKINGIHYLAHRLVFAYYHGRWPQDQIDHIDGDRQNNRIENLREVSPSMNMKNQKLRRDNTSGVIGVYWRNSISKWQSQIGINGRQTSIGSSSI